MTTYIEELGFALEEARLAIYEHRSGKPRAVEDAYIARWKNGGKQQPTPSVEVEEPIECPHLGKSTGKTRVSFGCENCHLEVFECSQFGECTQHKHAKPTGLGGKVKMAMCRECPHNPKNIERRERRTEKAQLRTTHTSTMAPFAQEKSTPETDLAYQSQADDFLDTLSSFPENKWAGRGITIAAGGRYWPSAYVSVRMIRHVGCTLPIQIWYLGRSGERDERYEKLLAPFGVECVDIDEHPARQFRRGVKGFQTKLFAAINSPFEEVLSLDPDNYPCTDPTILFDDPRYKLLGAIYWPDGPQTDGWTDWQMFGVKPRGPCGLETGQYVLHKRIAYEPMMLAEWYDDRPEWTYGKVRNGGSTPNDIVAGGDYGDKGPPRAAFAKLERDYVVFNPKVNWYKIAFVQCGPDGHSPMFIHRSRSKFVVDDVASFATTTQNGTNLRVGLPGEDAAFGYLEELRLEIAVNGAHSV